MSERCVLTLNSIFAQDQLTSDWGFSSSCVSVVHELAGDYWVDDETFRIFLTDFIDLLKRDQSFYYYFFTLPSSGSGILITDTFWHKLHVGTGSAHKWPKILQFLCIDDSWTCLKSLSWWWNTYNLQQRTSYCIQSGQSSGLSMGGKFDKRESTWHEFAFLWALRLLRCCHGGPEQSVRFTPTAKNATPQLQQDTRI